MRKLLVKHKLKFPIGVCCFGLLYWAGIARVSTTKGVKIPLHHVDSYMELFDAMGKTGKSLSAFKALALAHPSIGNKMLKDVEKMYQELEREASALTKVHRALLNNKLAISIATVACEAHGRDNALVLVKIRRYLLPGFKLALSHIFRSQDNRVLISGAPKTKMDCQLPGTGLHISVTSGVVPRPNMAGYVAALFHPEAIFPDVDALIYLDADTIAVSNLTEVWLTLSEDMRDGEVAAMTRNTEFPARGFYKMKSKIPNYGFSGVQAGVALMNLTETRGFGIEQKALDYFSEYKDRLQLANQDIYNIIFHFYPERLHLLDCSYNFYIYHCPRLGMEFNCYYHENEPGPVCFCHAILDEESGVRILHGNLGSLHKNYPFLMEIYRRFSEFNLLLEEPLDLILGLKDHFSSMGAPCFHLNSENLYRRAETYLLSLRKSQLSV